MSEMKEISEFASKSQEKRVTSLREENSVEGIAMRLAKIMVAHSDTTVANDDKLVVKFQSGGDYAMEVSKLLTKMQYAYRATLVGVVK